MSYYIILPCTLKAAGVQGGVATRVEHLGEYTRHVVSEQKVLSLSTEVG